ncbi:hypothetical protein [Pseudomonas sp. NPDC089534]|uniref:hypothetical protein n=1 Tax=Pseudomonas sp. NPDC089534 TaxID=3364468 RepID=UPI00381B3B4D
MKHDENIRAIIDFFQGKKIQLTIIEISDGEEWASVDPNDLNDVKISEELMLNELNSSDD